LKVEYIMTKVTTDDVRQRLGRDDHITIIDSRSADAWDSAETKAGGAIRIPPDDAADHVADVSRDDYLVIYCT
jgi:rhodanese-related sulfurtransferase